MTTTELQRFYNDLLQDIRSAQVAQEDGGIREQIFTKNAVEMLADAGETENARVVYDRKESKTGTVLHQINAFAIADNYETLDLFITIFNGFDDIPKIKKSDVDTAINRITRFFSNAFTKEYVKDIEESSEIFDLAHTLADSKDLKENLVRINIFILTDGIYSSEMPENEKKFDFSISYKVVDINYLYKISETPYIPIEIDFLADGKGLPCIIAVSENTEYQSYLATIPGEVLVDIYEKYGSRLLEQNVRSFLQFTGKINKGIRKTILEEPHMFLAFNNGIAATAEEVRVENISEGKRITWVKDLQIVNGGQTTASIYHTWRKDKADISKISVQIKLSVVRNKDKFGEIVSRIAEYANTQNKVSVADLSSNSIFHTELEKLSRTIWTPSQIGSNDQTRWFYIRARGQYKNALLKEGSTKAKKKTFEIQNPKAQTFSKEDLAKYVNSCQEIKDKDKIVIAPHFVARGNQKNYVQFMQHNPIKKPDSNDFEDTIAKAILFKTAENIYGIKPNAIGDLRYVTVPYAIGWLCYRTKYQIDFYKIWKNQSVSDNMKSVLYQLMVKIDKFIRDNATGSLYGEWAKKEECWHAIKNTGFGIDLSVLKSDTGIQKRRALSEDEINAIEMRHDVEVLKSVPVKIWDNLENWGKLTNKLNLYQLNIINSISRKVRADKSLVDAETEKGLEILDIVIKENPDLLIASDDSDNVEINNPGNSSEIKMEVVQKMIEWDSQYNVLEKAYLSHLVSISRGHIPLYAPLSQKYLKSYLETLKQSGLTF